MGVFAPPTSALVLLSTATAANNTSIDFTGLDSTYEEYELHMHNVLPAGTDNLMIRTSVDGVTYASGAADYRNGAATGNALVPGQVLVTVANGGFSGVLRIHDPAGTLSYKQLYLLGVVVDGAGSQNSFSFPGARESTAVVKGIRTMFSANNVLTGKFKLYGVKKQ